MTHGEISYPGCLATDGGEYLNFHGITPGVIQIRVLPQIDPPASFGTVTITDGENGIITLPDCRLDSVQLQLEGDRGFIWIVNLQDRRWRWKYGSVDGCYNQLDHNGKLLPASIASPAEMAKQCLDKMGEVGYSINMPPGLTSAYRTNLLPFLPTGINYPPTGSNPPVDWLARNPAEALQSLCDDFKCRVVYSHLTNTVSIVPVGFGGPLPPGGAIAKTLPSLKQPESADSVKVQGPEVNYQVRLLLQPVAEEWDGTFVPVNEVSYAPPVIPARRQIYSIGIILQDTGATAGDIFQVSVTDTNTGQGPVIPEQVFNFFAAGGEDTAAIAAGLIALINAGPNLPCAATFDGVDQLILTGNTPQNRFSIGTGVFTSLGPPVVDSTTAVLNSELTQEARNGVDGWSTCFPPNWANLQATDELTIDQARQLANRSVRKCYQVVDEDVASTWSPQAAGLPIFVPGYGRVKRQQLTLLNKQVDQIVPTTALPGIQRQGQLDQQVILDLYRGLSKDKPPRVYGAVALEVHSNKAGIMYTDREGRNRDDLTTRDLNSGPRDLVMIDFEIDPIWQMVKFTEFVYARDVTYGYIFPTLALQCAVNVRNPDTNQYSCFERIVPVPWGTGTIDNPKTEFHEDCVLNFTSSYTQPGDGLHPPNQLQSFNILEIDPIFRADFYINAMLQDFQLSNAEVRTWLGLLPVDCTGTIQQVHYLVHEGGCDTTAGYNSEFDPYHPRYPKRRRLEMLEAITSQSSRNRDASRWTEQVMQGAQIQ